MDGKASLDLRRCDGARKRERRSSCGSPESKHCRLDLRRGDGAKERKRGLAGAAPEKQLCKEELGRRSRAKRRERSASPVPESKRCKRDHSGTSRCKRKSQARLQRSTACSVESAEDDKEGHLLCRKGDVLNGRYEIVAKLGEGGFGRVVECIDRRAKGGRHVAVKIAKNTEDGTETAYDEIKVLEDLKARDPRNAFHCVQMLDWFEYHRHVCIVFELLGLSTHKFMRNNSFQPLSLDHIRQMAYQICTSVNFLHANKLTHTDLKPENIVFVTNDYEEEYNPDLKCNERRPRKPDIKVLDFGCATYDHEYHSPLVTTRPYRAPEVVLGLGWSRPCDVWSIGCTLLEYYLGYTVFQPRDDTEHLAMMERLLGPLPENMINRIVSSKKRAYFCEGRLVWNKHSAAGQYVSRRYSPLKEFMVCHDREHEQLFDLIQKMLRYNPAKRITLQEALKHPFFLPLKKEKRTRPPIAVADQHLCLPSKKRKLR